MDFKLTFWAILIIGMLLTAVAVIIGGWATEYGSGISSDLGDLSKMSDIADTAEEQKGKINPQSGEASSDFETETFRGGYGILTNIYNPLRVVFGKGGMVDSIGTRYGIPYYITQTVVVMIILAITFSIVAILFRLGRGNV